MKESTAAFEKLSREQSKDKEGTEQEKEKFRKEVEYQQIKLQKQWEKEKQELEEQVATLSDNLEMVKLGLNFLICR